MANVKTRRTTAKVIFASKGFVVGFKSIRRGKPLDYERYEAQGPQWSYEQGRQFALQYDGDLKANNRWCMYAMHALNTLSHEGTM
jgi:hypothetical protein